MSEEKMVLFLKFSDNSVVLLNKQNELIGTRVMGSVPRELRAKGFIKILSLAPFKQIII